MEAVFSERELEDFLCEGKNLEKYLGLKFVARQVNIAPAGIVDILAYDKSTKTWVIIELKQGPLDHWALMQGMSYLNFYQSVRKYSYISPHARSFGLLLIGDNLESSLDKVIDSFIKNTIRDGKITYSLFNLDFESGISFKYSSARQNEYSRKITALVSKITDIRLSNIIKASNRS